MSLKEKILVIVESPAKAKTINKYLGSDYLVDSSKGHLIDLPKSRMAVDVANNFQPEYKVIKGKLSILKELRKKAAQAKEVLLAADPDREGEAISWHLSNALKETNPNIKRIIFDEITKEAIQQAIKEPMEINQNLVNAQQARRILDRLVGYKLSPILWKKIKAGLSAGRVQSVALRLICEREKEIQQFHPIEYWSIDVEFIKQEKLFLAKLIKVNNEKIDIKNREQTDSISLLLKDSEFEVNDIIITERKRNPWPPYITSKLQQDSFNRLGYSSRKTMIVAQQLYEGVDIVNEGPVGLITYMRTDSTRISPVAIQQTREYIRKEYGEAYLPENPNYYKSGKNSQDAHESIRPTNIHRTPESIRSSLTSEQFKVYKLIYDRFLACQMTPAIQLQKSIMIKAKSNEKEFDLQINTSQYKFDGFTKVFAFSNKKEMVIPHLEKGEKLNFSKIISEQHFTQPPPRFSDASLVKILEESGIGRPSTYAPIVGTLEYRHYILREGRQLVPTELGILTNDLLVKNFPEILDINFTADMEEKLDEIAEAKYDWVQLLHEFYPNFDKTVNRAMEHIEEITDYKTGFPTDEVCEKCGGPMVKKLGRNGYFLACSNFPRCRNAKPLPIADCPRPGCGGKILQRRSKRRRAFYACTNPECKYILWSKPLKEHCPKCNYFLIYTKKNKKLIKKCSNETCDFFLEEKVNEDNNGNGKDQ